MISIRYLPFILLLFLLALLLVLQYFIFAPLAMQSSTERLLSLPADPVNLQFSAVVLATATPQPSAVRVRAGTVAIEAGQISVTVPLDLLGATDQQAVGVLSLTIQYDAAQLQADACPVNPSFDLLLCNFAQPGQIRLAGVVADGVRSDRKVADLDFTILQPDKLFTQLTVQVGTVANRDGDVLNVSGQNGQIYTLCEPDNGDCNNVYLPVVQR